MPTTRGDSDLELVQAVKDGTIGEFAQSARYQGAGSSVVNATKVDNTMDIIGDYPLNVVGFAPGYPRSGKGDPAMQARAVELAKQADVVLLYIGLDEISESEGLDRPHMRLPQSQTSLLQAVSAVNPNIVAVMSAGSAVEMPWLDQCRAVIHGYLYNARELADYYSGTIKAVSDRQFELLLGRPIPDGSWSGTLTMNDAICQMYYAKSGLARFVYRRLTGMLNKSLEKGTPNLNLMFNYNMPFRGIAKMTGGICTAESAGGILTMVNGHFFKGLGQIISGFVHAGKKHKAADAIR